MRMLLKIQIPVETGNAGVKNGALPRVIKGFAEAAKPEAMYFTLDEGMRTVFAVVDMTSSAEMPKLGEPFFRELNASIDARPCMNAEDLAAGLKMAGLA